mgnify:CR=1 FL=1
MRLVTDKQFFLKIIRFYTFLITCNEIESISTKDSGPDQIMSEFVNICLQKFRSIQKKVIEKNENFQNFDKSKIFKEKIKILKFSIFQIFFSTVNIVTVIVIAMTTLIPKMKNIGPYLFKTSKIIEIEPMTAENGRIKNVDILITLIGHIDILCHLLIIPKESL